MDLQYFAQLDANNVVIDVHVVTTEFMAANPERYPGVWVETFFSNPNKIYAGIGMTYDFDTQNFVRPPEPVVPFVE